MIRHICLAALAAFALPVSAIAQLGPPQDRYIVVLNEGLDLPEDVAADVALRTGGRVGYVYETVLRGFSITMPRAALAGVVRDPRVSYVEEDRPVSAFNNDQTIPTGLLRIFSVATVGDGTANAVDVDVAVLDTGIDWSHPDLDVAGGANCLGHTGGPPWQRAYICNEAGDFSDGNSHGTHVAGTIGAKDNHIGVVGVAPGARLWAVKVLDNQGSGSFGGIIAGVDWVVVRGDIEVINMSLGGETGGPYDPMDQAIAAAVEAGVTVVVAAGNSDADTKNYSPANSPDAFTVSALADSDGAAGGTGGSPSCRSDEDDTLANFSNWDPTGALIDIVAPGVCILSTVPGGGLDTFSGTSMASPHVAGAAALLASDTNAPTDRNGVKAIWHTLTDNGNCNWLDDSGDGFKEPLLDLSGAAQSGGSCAPDGGGGSGGGGTESSIHVHDLDGSAAKSGRSWTATVTISVTDDAEKPVSSATVTGKWSPVGGTGGCTTGSDGLCSINLSGIPNNASSVIFDVTDVSAGTTLTYNSTDNHDADGDSDGTRIVIAKP